MIFRPSRWLHELLVMHYSPLQLRHLHQLGILPHDAIKASNIQKLEQGTLEWHEQRRVRLGASEVAAVAGRSRYITPQQLLKNKRDPVEPSAAMRRGQRVEAALADLYIRHVQVCRAQGHCRRCG